LEEGKEKEKDLSIHGDGGRHYADALDAASHGLLLLLLLALQGRAVQVDFNLSNDRPTSSTTLAPSLIPLLPSSLTSPSRPSLLGHEMVAAEAVCALGPLYSAISSSGMFSIRRIPLLEI